MRAAVLEAPRRLVLKTVRTPKPGRGWVLIRVGACGICGSDVRYYMGENPWALHTLGMEEPMPPNTILGHEVAGTIVRMGEDVDEERLGQRIGVIAFNTCNLCYYCRTGLHNLCENTLHIGHDGRWSGWEYVPGGYADYMPVWNDKAHEIPEGLSFIEATQLDGLAVAIHAAGRGRIAPGDAVAVIGAGAVGLLALQVAKAYGATKTIAVDIRDYPLEVAARLGADVLVNSSREDVAEAILRETRLGANVIIDTVGRGNVFRSAFKALARAGRYVLLAIKREKVEIDLLMLAGERVITSSSNNLFPEYTTAVQLMASGVVRAKPFITHIYGLDEVHEAFKVALSKEEHNAIKVVLVP